MSPSSLLLLLLLLVPLVSSFVLPRNEQVAKRRERRPTMSKEQAVHLLKEGVRRTPVDCRVCATIVDALDTLLEQETPEEEIDQFVKNACISLNIEQPHVCDGLVDVFADEVYFVVERVIFTPEEMCSIFLDDCGVYVNPLVQLWNISIPGNKPPVQPWPVVTNPQKTLRILHLSDIHIDRQYAVGSEAFCKDDNGKNTYALCCRIYPPTADGASDTDVKVPAGKWGSLYNCDIPYIMFDNAMKNIAAAHKDLDYILITGDFEAHDMWDYTQNLTIANIANVTAVLLLYFPNIPIYESVGNHEGVPMDAMAPHSMEEYDTRGPQWLYSSLVTSWSNWLSSDSLADVQYRASYVAYPAPGLKLISLNTIYCSKYNFYLYINQTDPDDTMQWLIQHLLESEAKGEKVHLISHIPAGDDYCLKGWSQNFYDVVNRFENTIAAQYYGHTHQDHFEVYYEDSTPTGRPTQMNFISPSITTYSYNNPSYRIYTVDGGYEGATYTTLDAETYSTDIELANESGNEPQWSLEYSMRQDYKMPDLSPASFNDLISRLETDDDLFKKFHQHYYRQDYNPDCVNTPSCRQNMICFLKAAKSFEEDVFCAGMSRK